MTEPVNKPLHHNQSSLSNTEKKQPFQDLLPAPTLADGAMSPQKILLLQRMIGNRATRQLISTRMTSPIHRKATPVIQTASAPKTHLQRILAITPDSFVGGGKAKGMYNQLKVKVTQYHTLKADAASTSEIVFAKLQEIATLANTWMAGHKKNKTKDGWQKSDALRGPVVETLLEQIQSEMGTMMTQNVEFGEEGAFGASSTTNTDRGKKELIALNVDGARKQYERVGIMTPEQSAGMTALNDADEDLTQYGLLPFADAVDRADANVGTDFGPKSPYTDLQKLQIATIQVRDLQKTDGIGYARWMGIKAGGPGGDADAQEYLDERDVSAWERTMATPERGALATALGPKKAKEVGPALAKQQATVTILQRIFMVLQKGLKYRQNQDDPHLEEWTGPVAKALSHGGRVNIFLPPVENMRNKDDFWNWLTGGEAGRKAAGLNSRFAATHGFSFDEEGAPREEKLGKKDAVMTKGHFGWDIPVGGLGSPNASGAITMADGTNGHMYINYQPPTLERQGALLIGVESSASGKSNPYGKGHDTSGRAGEFSATGGLKKNKLGSEYGGMVVDLSGEESDELVGDLLEFEEEVTEGLEEGTIAMRDLVGSKAALTAKMEAVPENDEED